VFILFRLGFSTPPAEDLDQPTDITGRRLPSPVAIVCEASSSAATLRTRQRIAPIQAIRLPGVLVAIVH
jgi:hypothetical protein